MAVGFEEFESSKAYAPRPVLTTGPSPERYEPTSRSTPARRQDVSPEDISSADLYAQKVAKARRGVDTDAKFVLMDLPVYETRMTRAAKDQDVETLGQLVSEVDGYLNEHYDGLTRWTGLSQAGARGKAAANRLAAFLDGSYKDVLGIRDLLDDSSEDRKNTKASRLSKELGVGTGAARAMFDRDDKMYPVFSLFSDLAAPPAPIPPGKSAPTVPAGQPVRMTRASRLDFLHGVESADVEFSSPGSRARFVSSFDQLVNKNGAYAGDDVFKKTAQAFVDGRHGLTEHDFLAQYGALVDSLSDQATGGASAKNVSDSDRRRARHEANAIASEFVSMLASAGEPIGGTEAASALESAAATVRMADDMFGVTHRGDVGYARKVASVAAASMGRKVGLSDDGTARLVADAAADLSSLASRPTRELMAAVADGKGRGQVGTVKAQNPYSNVEMFAIKELGRAMSGLSDGVDGAMPSGKTWGALKKFASTNESARGRLVDAMTSAIDARFGSPGLSRQVAGTLVNRLLGIPDPRSGVVDGRTMEELVRGYTGDFDPVTGEPEIPAGTRIAPNMSDNEFNKVLASVAADPGSVVPSMRGETAKSLALKQFAVATLERRERGKQPESSMDWHRALGRLAIVAGADRDDPSRLVESGLLSALLMGRSKKFSTSGWKWSYGWADRVDAQKKLVDMVSIVVNRPGGDLSVDDAIKLGLVLGSEVWKENAARGYRSAGAAPGTVGDTEFRFSAVDKLARRLLQDKFGVPPSASKETLMQVLASNPAIKDSTLVSSGFIDPRTGNINYKGLLANLQERAYADAYVERKDKPTLLQREARRVYQSFGSRDDQIGKLKSDVIEHFRTEGATEEELLRLDGVVSGRLAKVYQNGGLLAAEKLARKQMMMSRWYLPVVDLKSKEIVPSSVRMTGIKTEEEYKAEVEQMKKTYKEMGIEIPDAAFFDAHVRGRETWLHNFKMRERIGMYNATHNGEQSQEH